MIENFDNFPNLYYLNHQHLADPSPPGEKTIFLNFSSFDFQDASGVEISFKACKTADDLGEWYADRCNAYPSDIVPYLVHKTLHPKHNIPSKAKKGFYKQLGNFMIRFR